MGTSSTSIYSLSLHDALPILESAPLLGFNGVMNLLRRYPLVLATIAVGLLVAGDRKSTRLNSSHVAISYTVFCLKKKKKTKNYTKQRPTTEFKHNKATTILYS